jgi:uncharacterized membrane protein YfcA
MTFSVSGATVNPIFLIAIGFVVGILGGFFGVGGGFIAAPLMYLSGVPMNFVIGTDLAHMTGKSIVAARRHRTLGHVDARLGVALVPPTIIGVEVGARAIEALEAAGSLDAVVGTIYVVILLCIGTFTAWESYRALRGLRREPGSAQDSAEFRSVSRRVQLLRLPPLVAFPRSGIPSVSIWAVLGVGFLTGVLAGTLGVGGGFVRMPLLVYALGVPTHIAVGTDLFSIVFSAGYGTVTHALKGNVDVLMALTMSTGAALGAQIGAVSTRYFTGPRIRLLFSVLPFVGALMMILQLTGTVPGH